jgi:glycosyltransferase involved in cell wall biosynthesis
MKIGLALYGDIETRSGGFRYDRKLVSGLCDRGNTVEVYSLPWPSYPRGLLEGYTEAIDRFPTDLDVLLEDELAHPTLVGLNLRLRDRLACPIVPIVHHLRCDEAHPRPARACYRAVERRYLRGVDAAICNSEATRESVLGLADIPTTVAPPAGDRFDPAIDRDRIIGRAHEGPLQVLFLGSVIPRKNLDGLVRALSTLPDERWRLHVVGDRTTRPTYARRIDRLIDRLGIGDRVGTHGRLPDEALEALLGTSHVLALPSTHEGFGIAYLEGMGFGLPALATTAGGARSIVTHGETGFLCPPGDDADLARRLRALADDRDRLAELGIGARERFEAHPGWAESTRRVGRFLDRTVAGNLGSDDCNVDERHLGGYSEEGDRALA